MLSPADMTQMFQAIIPILAHNGFRITHTAPGVVHTFMPLEPNQNHLGSVYAGSLCTMAEASGGALLASALDLGRFRLMVKSLSIEYHRLALSDVHCVLHAPADLFSSLEQQCEAEGKGFYVLEVDIFDAADERVATGTLNYRVKRLE